MVFIQQERICKCDEMQDSQKAQAYVGGPNATARGPKAEAAWKSRTVEAEGNVKREASC